MKRLAPLSLVLTLVMLAACAPVGDGATSDDESSATYALATLDGAPFRARATLTFGPGDAVGGQAPCNRWSAALLSDLPEFRTDGIMSTEMACDDLPAEGVFFAAMAAMTRAEVTAETVVLTGPGGRSMVFRAAE